VWAAEKNGQRLGVATTLTRAKAMVAEHDSGIYDLDHRLALLKDAYAGKGHMHEVWGGDPARMPPAEYEQAKQRMAEVHDSVEGDSLFERELRALASHAIIGAAQDRATRAYRDATT